MSRNLPFARLIVGFTLLSVGAVSCRHRRYAVGSMEPPGLAYGSLPSSRRMAQAVARHTSLARRLDLGFLRRRLRRKPRPHLGRHARRAAVAEGRRSLDTLRGDDKGFIWVGDAPTSRILKFDLNGNFLYAWGAPGPQAGRLNCSHGITTDQLGNLYLADCFAGRLQKFETIPGADSRQDRRTDPPDLGHLEEPLSLSLLEREPKVPGECFGYLTIVTGRQARTLVRTHS